MECIQPIYIKKHFAHVPCGKCGNCLQRKISDWSYRCQVEAENSLYSLFATLTYEADPLQLYKVDLQNFFKRIRRAGGEFTYFAIGDYGDTYGRPHYHVLFFVKNEDFPSQYFDSLWRAGNDFRTRGFTQLKPVTWGRIRYVVKYGLLAKLDWDRTDTKQKPFFLMSKRPAIGASYLTEKRVKWHQKQEIRYVPSGVFKLAMPRYYRDKIFRRNPALAELEKDKYLRERLIRLDEILIRQKPNLNQNPLDTYYDRITTKSHQVLSRMRADKRMKNRNL